MFMHGRGARAPSKPWSALNSFLPRHSRSICRYGQQEPSATGRPVAVLRTSLSHVTVHRPAGLPDGLSVINYVSFRADRSLGACCLGCSCWEQQSPPPAQRRVPRRRRCPAHNLQDHCTAVRPFGTKNSYALTFLTQPRTAHLCMNPPPPQVAMSMPLLSPYVPIYKGLAGQALPPQLTNAGFNTPDATSLYWKARRLQACNLSSRLGSRLLQLACPRCGRNGARGAGEYSARAQALFGISHTLSSPAPPAPCPSSAPRRRWCSRTSPSCRRTPRPPSPPLRKCAAGCSCWDSSCGNAASACAINALLVPWSKLC